LTERNDVTTPLIQRPEEPRAYVLHWARYLL